MSATLADQTNRLQHFMCCLGEYGNKLSLKLKLGLSSICEINTFQLLVMYWDVLECYNPENETNCLTQSQIDLIWDDISEKCGICFSPYGSTYILEGTIVRRITEDGTLRITENGNQRIIESGQYSNNLNDGIDYMYIDDSHTPHFIIR